jgi:YVTN family beta-propeller protein
MRVVRCSRLLVILAAAAIELSCGDTFRPIAVPENPQPPNPATLHFQVVLTANGPEVCPSGATANCDPSPHSGGSSRIDVSGDSNVGTASVGLGPVHAVLLPPSGNQAFVANQLDNTITTYATSDSTTLNTISLPPNSVPQFLATTQTDTLYSANKGTNSVSVISIAQSLVTKTIPVGNNPIAMAETPDGKKLYVVNQGDGTVTAINTIDGSINATIPTGANPVWAIARVDNAKVYVLNQGSGTLSVIDTATDTAAPGISVGAANYMAYDQNLGRLYLTVPSPSAALVVLNVEADPPVALAQVNLSTACPSGCVLDSVTTLPDGSKAYVSSHTISGTCSQLAGAPLDLPPCITTQVTVIRATGNTVQKTITPLHTVYVNSISVGSKPDVPVVALCNSARFRRHIAAAGDGSRVYVANCDAGGTDIIRTVDDSFLLNLPAPVSSAPPLPGQTFPPPQNPVFVLSGR